jgi:hypothetical protein
MTPANYCHSMRGPRAGTTLAALLVTALLALSMGASASAAKDSAHAVHPARRTDTMGKPFVNATFNHPSQGSAQQGTDWRAIADDEFGMAANAIPPGFSNYELQVSMFRVSDTILAQALVDDANQGATVQVLLNGAAETLGCRGKSHCVSPTFAILEQLNTINHQAGRSATWLRTCAGYGPDHPNPQVGAGNGCLGQSLNHNKFMLASHGTWGGSELLQDVVLQTSSNDVNNQAIDAFNNELMVANRPALYHDYQRYFARLAAAYRSTKPTSSQRFTERTGAHIDDRTLSGHDIETLSYPRAPDDDPLLAALRSVSTAHRCANRSTAPDSPAHTTVYLGMFDIKGRGDTLHELAQLARAGCRIHIVYTTINPAAYRTLHRHRISLQQLCTTHTMLHRARYYVHSKYLLVSGTTRALGRDRRIIYTGSENLTSGSLTDADNRDIRYVEAASDAPIYSAYLANFEQMNALGADKPELGYRCSATDTD